LIFSSLVEGSFAEEGSSLNRRGGEEEGREEARRQHFRWGGVAEKGMGERES
jgi:hypothetical protein